MQSKKLVQALANERHPAHHDGEKPRQQRFSRPTHHYQALPREQRKCVRPETYLLIILISLRIVKCVTKRTSSHAATRKCSPESARTAGSTSSRWQVVSLSRTASPLLAAGAACPRASAWRRSQYVRLGRFSNDADCSGHAMLVILGGKNGDAASFAPTRSLSCHY